MYSTLMLIISLILIIISANLLCNALEHLGEYLGISDGVIGSLFAAVATALPETIIPILTIFNFHFVSSNLEIGIGAIIGAPLMLSTLSVFIMALAIISKRGLNGKITPEISCLKRDISFFLLAYAIALLATFIHLSKFYEQLKIIFAIILGIIYCIYIALTIKSSKNTIDSTQKNKLSTKLFLQYLNLKLSICSIILQLIIALSLLIYTAEILVSSINIIARLFSLSPFLISLIIIPIATELPEKINSILWLRKAKDTLAMSNITGAMVFQGTLLPIIGILFMPWDLNKANVISISITIIATLWLYYNAKNNNIRIWHFLFNGILYGISILSIIIWR